MRCTVLKRDLVIGKQIIFFDGVCNLCNGFIDFVVTRDPEHNFKFAPLQGETAKRHLPNSISIGLRSVVLWTQGQYFEKSDAILMILPQLGGGWRIFRLGWIFPRFFRDWIYDFVARNRYRFFGKRDSCRLPTPEERALFLD
jgi:predicted DCC family thiol-disulfide oxidoreductase YuxK